VTQTHVVVAILLGLRHATDPDHLAAVSALIAGDDEHGAARHVHVHAHSSHGTTHEHEHVPDLRTVRGAYGIGLLHGIGGSAGIGILLLAAIPDAGVGMVALMLFAAFTAVSMGVASSLFGRALSGDASRRRLSLGTPALGAFNFAFGAWYALGALGALGTVPYIF